MNWLAHALLSEPDTEVRIGNVLADLVKGRERKQMSDAFLQGVKHHQKIDAFTDTHPVFLRSCSRVSHPYRRFAGILINIFYDHFLASNWEQYAAIPLETFTGELYADIQAYPITFSEDVQYALDRLIADDRLGMYQHIDGIQNTLKRISNRIESRTGRDFELDSAITQLTDNYNALSDDFAHFFPLLITHVQACDSQL